jgi:phytanoyl-CoA hydroxylase
MKSELSQEQITFYSENGYVIIEDFLNGEELEKWRTAVTEAIKERNGQKMPGKSLKIDEDDGINKDADYYNKVFDQLLNLWQTSDKVKELMLDERIGKLAADLSA